MKYFTIKEFEKSDTANKLKIDNKVPAGLIKNIEELVDNILDPLREAWGSGIIIASGYRSPALNAAVGGVKTSAHSQALAVDIVPTNGKLQEFKKFTLTWLKTNNIKFDQYIDEQAVKSSWVHLSYKNIKGFQRKLFLLYRNGKYTNIK